MDRLETYYCTFGTDPNFPYQGGWVEIMAPDGKTAGQIFKTYYPNRKGSSLLNCAFVYSEERWKEITGNYDMGKCHARIAPVEKLEDPYPGMTKSRIADILISYIDNDLESADPGWVREVIETICTEAEIKELGLYNWLGFEETA